MWIHNDYITIVHTNTYELNRNISLIRETLKHLFFYTHIRPAKAPSPSPGIQCSQFLLNYTLKSHEDLHKHWCCGLTPRDSDLFWLGYSWTLRILSSPGVSNVLRKLKTTQRDACTRTVKLIKLFIYNEKIIFTVGSK